MRIGQDRPGLFSLSSFSIASKHDFEYFDDQFFLLATVSTLGQTAVFKFKLNESL
jgi:hypothetical protein